MTAKVGGRLTIENMVFPLSQTQEGRISTLTSNSIRREIQGYCEYFRSVKEARAELMTTTRIGAAIGAVFGLLGAMFVLSQDEEKDEKHVKAMKVGTCGVLSGAFIGSLFGAGYTINTTLKLDAYTEWKFKVLPDKVFPMFRQFLQASELENFMCPITQDLIVVPVKDPTGKVYEKGAIENWINEKNKSPMPDLSTLPDEATRNSVRFRTSPTRHMDLQLKDLKYDLGYHDEVVTILKRLHDQQIQQQLNEGLLSYRAAVLKEREDLMADVIGHVSKKQLRGEITKAEFSQVVEACNEHYNRLT